MKGKGGGGGGKGGGGGGKGRGGGGGKGVGSGSMKASGGEGYISWAGFESNPQEYNQWLTVRKFEHPECFENKTTITQGEGEQSRVQEWTSRANYEDRQCGNYSRLATKEKVSSSEFVDKHSGRVGHKEEKTVTSTVKFGNKYKGYSGEYIVEEKLKLQSVNFKNKSKKY